MKSLNSILTLLLLLTCGGTVSCGQVLPEAKVTLVVRDEDGQPVEGAKAHIGFEVISSRSFESKVEGKAGLTDATGSFTASSATRGYVFYGTEKAGYYDSKGPMYQFKRAELGRWEPYNVGFVLTLKKIVNPVPMYAKQINLGMPALDVPVGFDLAVGDWTAPYGKGSATDLIFTGTMDKRGEDEYDYKLTVSFPHPKDGIQLFEAPYNYGSSLKSAREAPADGYLPQLVLTTSKRRGSPKITNKDGEKHNYFLRVRTIVNAQGQIVSACYGKVYGEFMNCTYYLNPDETRNVEYDPKRNLITHLKSFERPNAP